eukprot:3596632-Prymnesium_polylepis.1
MQKLDALVASATAGMDKPQLHRTLQSKQKGAYMSTLYSPKELAAAEQAAEEEVRSDGGSKAARKTARAACGPRPTWPCQPRPRRWSSCA